MRIVEPTHAAILEAAEAIQQGKLVVIPTETVYGLAADATNPEAVRSIFAAKGRPSENPLIVHVADPVWLTSLTSIVPDYARALIGRYWPGPLTLVLPKQPSVPSEVTAGLDTVAVRMPSHPVALELIREAKKPIAAPSANRFMALSPTKAANVDPELADHAVMVLDGGPCEVGLESTVLDCTGPSPRLLRPGRVSRAEIESLLGMSVDDGGGVKRAPGMYPRHYAPKTRLHLVTELGTQAGLAFGAADSPNQRLMPSDPELYAAQLYGALYELDQLGLDSIHVEKPPETAEWEAVWDRLRKASTQ
jgi:L-threonylcarbamoyladenylate synthase